MRPLRLIGLAVLSGALLALSWPAIGVSFLLVFALVPLLLISEAFLQSKRGLAALKVYGYSYLAVLIWNVGATWWVVNASFTGALLAFFANSALMAGVFTFGFQLRRRYPGVNSAWLHVIPWLAFEYLHHDWDLTWPWLTLGNAFANDIQLVQWYEFTGTAGGSLWIWAMNIGLLGLYRRWSQKQPLQQSLRRFALVLLLPVLVSMVLYFRWEEKGNAISVAVVQPNVDPYNEKFENGTLQAQLDRFLALAATVCDSNTAWLLGPETALVRSIPEDALATSKRILKIQEFMQAYPGMMVLIGAETHHIYAPGEPVPSSARTSPDGQVRFDMYNTALSIGRDIKTYHKSKLVPGVEQMPFPWIFRFVEDFAIDLGGTTGSLGTQSTRPVFKSDEGTSTLAPAICYESVYGDFLTAYIRAGAQYIAVITNDGWWGDTPGYKQHLAYARLRAIENRRDVVRSANTGISAFINQRGEILQATEYWKPAAIKGAVHLNTEKTLFSLAGDWLGKAAVWLSLFLWLWGRMQGLLRRRVRV
jgi:apolipoprotein N-acyltransferase